METLYGNPSSSHITGLRARYILESTRGLATTLLGATNGRIIFTSGATEAIQMAVFSSLCHVLEARAGRPAAGPRRALLYGATEHKAVPEALRHWNRVLGVGDEVLEIPVDARGLLDLAFLREHAPRADMVSTMAVNNETGIIHDLLAIEEVLRDGNPEVPWLVDSVQAVGKLELDLSGRTIDYAPVSGHKLYAPKGIGLLYVRDGAPLTPLIAGGGQESGARSGTENLPGVAALGAVFECLLDRENATFQDLATLGRYRDRLSESLGRAFPDIVFNAPFEHAVPTTINFSVKGFSSKELLDLFDAAGVRVSSGSACGSALKGSYVLEAMGLPAWRSDGAIRLSFGPAVTETEISAACRVIEEAGKALRRSCLLLPDDLELAVRERQDGLIQLKRGASCSWVFVSAGAGTCVVIDPVAELAERIEHLVRCQGHRVLAVLDTHDHADHISCRELLLGLLGEPTGEGARGTDHLGWPESASGEVRLGDGSTAAFLRLSDHDVLAMTELPGHTADARAYLLATPGDGDTLQPPCVRFAFTGDTVLVGGLGRTDLSTSSAADLFDSLHRLDRIVSDTTLICPTHDYTNDFATTLPAEKRNNALLARVLGPGAAPSQREFVREKRILDGEISRTWEGEFVCGHVHRDLRLESSIDVHPDDLPAFFAGHRESLVVDCREPHEYQLFRDWASLGMEEPPENIPLTRFSDFLQRLLEERPTRGERDIIFVCRSGNRSGKVAEVLRRLGIETAWHIAGGIALGGRPRHGTRSATP